MTTYTIHRVDERSWQRDDRTWQRYVCSDCDPDGGEDRWDKPYEFMLPVDEAPPDNCPRCGSSDGLLAS